MTKLWQKGYSLNEKVERFEAAQNSVLDARLIRHDVWGNLAHIAMLQKIGILSAQEHQVLKEALRRVLDLEASGEFEIKLSDEDVHTSVENFLATSYRSLAQ
jgi:argininosuccinate lyase